MEYLEAPWRIQYIQRTIGKKDEGCIMCLKHSLNNDAEHLVLYRGRYNFVMMNLYPYNGGHLMVAPLRHVARMSLLAPEELHEHIDLVSRSIDILQQVFNPDGFNSGLHLGRVAGAGVEQHMHTLIVPRWVGDSNFMPVLAETLVINEALSDTYAHLKPYFNSVV